MTIRVACCQIPLPVGDTAGNRATATTAIEGGRARRRADRRAAGTGVVGLRLRRPRRTRRRWPRPATARPITEWANLAEAFGLTIVAGFPEAAGDTIYNSAAVVDPTGLRGVYRKAHLWDTENAVFDRGDDLPLVVDTDHGRIGVMICYDIEFPEWVRGGRAVRRRPAVRTGELAAAAAAGRRAADRDGAGARRGRDEPAGRSRCAIASAWSAVRTGSAAA